MGTEVIPEKEESLEEPSELEQKIIRQIEYYFGNFNLSKDKFLKEEIKNDDGWVPLETLVRFNRLKQLSSDYQVIAAALKKSKNQLLEVNEDCTKIRRKTPVPENLDRNELDERCLYVKGFKRDTKLDEILDFFKGHKVENIFMRKKKQGNKVFFKGSVFATFETKEDSEAFLEKKGLKFDKVEMIKERKKEYVKRKDIFYDNLREEKAKKEAERAKMQKEDAGDYTKGCLLRISGLKGDISRDDLRAEMEKLGKTAFVDYFKGNEDATIRFDEAIVADAIKDLPEEDGEKKLEICDVKVNVALIEGEDEEKYWQVVLKSKANSRQRGNTKFGNKGRFNKKQRNKRYKGGRNKNDSDEDHEVDTQSSTKKVKRESPDADGADAESDQPPSKKVKTETNENNNADSAKEPMIVSAD